MIYENIYAHGYDQIMLIMATGTKYVSNDVLVCKINVLMAYGNGEINSTTYDTNTLCEQEHCQILSAYSNNQLCSYFKWAGVWNMK